jgi:hypothetical protein
VMKYWSTLPPCPNLFAVFSSFLDEGCLEYIHFGCKSQKLNENFDKFMKMTYELDRVGNPRPFLDILVIKKFSCKLLLDKRAWKQTTLFFTVDSHLLFYDCKMKKVELKLLIQGLKVERMSENVL